MGVPAVVVTCAAGGSGPSESSGVEYNLRIELGSFPVDFGKREDSPVLIAHAIEATGLAIGCAKRHLVGDWVVTKEGRLTRGTSEGLPQQSATVDIHDNRSALMALGNTGVSDGVRLNYDTFGRLVHIHLGPEGKMKRIGRDKHGLYLL